MTGFVCDEPRKTKAVRSEKQDVSTGILRQDAELSRDLKELEVGREERVVVEKAGGPEDKILREKK